MQAVGYTLHYLSRTTFVQTERSALINGNPRMNSTGTDLEISPAENAQDAIER